MVERAGREAKLAFKAHPLSCRTPAGTHWRTSGTTRGRRQTYLGHKNIQHTVRYTELSPTV